MIRPGRWRQHGGRADQEAEEALQVSGQRAQQLVLEKAAIIRDAEEAATRANRH
jgi:hypothetical protein